MNTIENISVANLHGALAATGRSSEISDEDDAYGWLVGSWELDVKRYWAVDVSSLAIKGEVHAGWVLEGRAIQDVWIMPRRGERPAIPDKRQNMCGTTLRAWDSSIRAWRITWSNPVGEHFEQQVGNRNGDQIVQLGVRPDNTLTRWSFTEITADSFHWLGESQTTDGMTWNLEGEFVARRTQTQ